MGVPKSDYERLKSHVAQKEKDIYQLQTQLQQSSQQIQEL